EAVAEVLHPDPALAVDKRGQEQVIDVAAPGTPRVGTVSANHLIDRCRRAGEEAPPRQVRPMCFRVTMQHRWCADLRVDGDRYETHACAEISRQPPLQRSHLRGEE